MPKIGMCKSGGWHVILVAAAAFFAMTVVEPVLICAATAQRAEWRRIREIQVAGNRRVEPETVRSYLKFNVGDAYDPGKVDQSIKALFATGLFADVRIDRESTGVLVTVVENPVINQVAFEGNREADKDTLGAEVQLKPRAVFTRARAQADVQSILDVYRRQGRFAAVGRSQDHRARQQSRQRRVRDQRGRGDQGEGHQLHRQPRVLRQPSCATSSPPRSPACSTSSRAPTSTTPTGWRSIASCCGSTT